jgi:hypothetical protein
MELLTIDRLAEKDYVKLSDRIGSFLGSSIESTMLYNHVKLMMILQEKELNALADNETTVKKAINASAVFGNVTSMLHTDMEEGIREYYRLVEHHSKIYNGDVYIYVKQWGLSVEALYYYKLNNFDLAFSLTLECIALNEYLVNRGMQTLALRIVEQNRNLYRVLLKMGKQEEGEALAKNINNYLFNGTSAELLYGGVFRNAKLWSQIQYIREGYSYEYFRGLIIMMVSKGSDDPLIHKNLFLNLFGDFNTKITTPDRQIIYNWIQIKKTFYEGKYAAFVKSLIFFMNEPISQLYDILKIFLIQDLIFLVKSDNSKFKNELLNKLQHFLNTKLNRHASLRDNLSSQLYNQLK